MEESDENPKEASKANVVSGKHDSESGLSTQQTEEDTVVEISKDKAEEIKKFITPQTIANLQRDLTTSVTNIQTAADAKESLRRKELEEARSHRLALLENEAKSSQEKFEEITRGWSIAKQKVIPQELQEAVNTQRELCAAVIEDKKKLINDLQQELKVRDDRYVKELRKQEEELNLMIERMEDQIKTLTKAYREELAQIERVYQQECEVLLTRDRTEWEQCMQELLEKELDGLKQRKKKVEEYEETIHNLIMETMYKNSLIQREQNAKSQVAEREHQKIKATRMIAMLKQLKQEDESVIHKFNLSNMRSRATSLQTELKNLWYQYAKQEKEFQKKNHSLCEDYKRNLQQYERIQRKIKHFAAADSRKFKEMWLMIDAELKQLAERVVLIDSLICKQLGLAWERPTVPFRELPGPIQPRKQTLQCNQRTAGTSLGPKQGGDTESTAKGMYHERTGGQEESDAEVMQLELTMEAVMELLCDETGFLMEGKLLQPLVPMKKSEQTVVKLSSLLTSLGIEEEDFPKLSQFLIKHKQQRDQTEPDYAESGESNVQTEEVRTNSTSHLNPELIDPNDVVPALKSFLEQITRSRESSAQHCSSFQHVDVCGASKDAAYWDSISNIISEDKLKVWDMAEMALKQYHVVSREISELLLETQSLEQQNRELRMLLQQSLNPEV